MSAALFPPCVSTAFTARSLRRQPSPRKMGGNHRERMPTCPKVTSLPTPTNRSMRPITSRKARGTRANPRRPPSGSPTPLSTSRTVAARRNKRERGRGKLDPTAERYGAGGPLPLDRDHGVATGQRCLAVGDDDDGLVAGEGADGGGEGGFGLVVQRAGGF